MIIGYWKTSGKRPIEKEENRTLYSEPPSGDYCGVYEQNTIVRIDIDDYNHNTEELEEPLNGKPRSEAVISYLEEYGYKYNAIKTEHGVHITMLLPKSFPIESNKLNWYCAMGIKIEAHVTKVFEPIVVNGIKRNFIKGDLLNTDIDVLPCALYPIQKSKEKPFLMTFTSGDRNNSLSEYAFYLGNKGLSANEIQEVIKAVNKYVIEEPLSDAEINTILRPETMEKLKNLEISREEKNLSHVQIGQEIIEHFSILTTHNLMYQYKNGVYIPISSELIGKFVRKNHPAIKKSLKDEALSYVQDITFMESVEEDTKHVNVKNGLLLLNEQTKEVCLLPHTPEVKSFRQFNASYNPNEKSDVLENTLQKFFDNNEEQMLLFKQMLGYLLMNNTAYQKCFFFVGLPSSGKSKILNMIRSFCGGKAFVSSLSLKELDDKYRPAEIVGKTANINADLEKAKIFSTGNFKSLVTGDAITFERKYSKPFSYTNTAKLIFASNQNPDFSKDFEGIYRRVIIFLCNHVFKKTDADFNPNIDRELQSNECLSALLNMAIQGYFSLIENNGFSEGETSQNAVESFKIDNDTVLQWIKDCEITEDLLLREPIKNGFSGLYNDYKAFCITISAEPKQQKDFSRTICNEYGMETHTKRIQNIRCQFFRKKY